ncbi:MAG TPA: hypothetical protein VNE41_00035 [Chitinophagaceae bacterium]|nr:hypothetical protein [Chitinophagaceae bacterium]
MSNYGLQIQRLGEKLQLLVKKYRQLEQEHQALHKSLDLKNAEQIQHRVQVDKLEEKIRLLKMKTGNQLADRSEEERRDLQNLITEYIREIDRCIAELNT